MEPENLGASFHVQDLQFGADVPVGHPLMRPVARRVVADGADHDVVRLRGSIGRVRSGEVWEAQEGVTQLAFGFGTLPLDCSQFVAKLPALVPQFLCFGRLAGPHGIAHLLREDLYPPSHLLSFAG